VFPILIGAVAITVVEVLFQLPFLLNLGICGFAFFWALVCKEFFDKKGLYNFFSIYGLYGRACS